MTPFEMALARSIAKSRPDYDNVSMDVWQQWQRTAHWISAAYAEFQRPAPDTMREWMQRAGISA